MLLGGVIGATLEDDDRSHSSSLLAPSPKAKTTPVGALIGFLAGLSIGVAFPIEVGSDAVYESPINEEDLEGLRDKSRYKDEEPYFLTKIRNNMK